jgi:hypothetical protein
MQLLNMFVRGLFVISGVMSAYMNRTANLL